MAAKTETYAPGSHTGAVRALHDARRTELLARDDIHQALQLMSPPAETVVALKKAAE